VKSTSHVYYRIGGTLVRVGCAEFISQVKRYTCMRSAKTTSHIHYRKDGMCRVHLPGKKIHTYAGSKNDFPQKPQIRSHFGIGHRGTPQPQRKRKGDFGIGHHKNPPLQRKRKRSMGRAGGPETSS
jgi:hypothetical protein